MLKPWMFSYELCQSLVSNASKAGTHACHRDPRARASDLVAWAPYAIYSTVWHAKSRFKYTNSCKAICTFAALHLQVHTRI